MQRREPIVIITKLLSVIPKRVDSVPLCQRLRRRSVFSYVGQKALRDRRGSCSGTKIPNDFVNR